MNEAIDTNDRQYDRFCESLAAMGFYEAVDQGVQFVIWYVCEDKKLPSGSTLSSFPISPPFRRRADAEAAKAELIHDHPDAGIFFGCNCARDAGPAWQWEDVRAFNKENECRGDALTKLNTMPETAQQQGEAS